jgi:hypothetical protein
MQHYARQARNTKLIDAETDQTESGTSRSELLREMAERREGQSGGGCQKLAHAPPQPSWSPSARFCAFSASRAAHIACKISSSDLPRSPVSIIGRGVP